MCQVTYLVCCSAFSIFFCLLTGQLTVCLICSNHRIPTVFKGFIFVTSTLSLLIFVLVNLLSFVFDVIAIAWCPFENCSFIYISMNETQYILTNNTINTASVGVPAPEQLNELIDWWKVVFTTGTISGLLSYYLMVILVLCLLYGACAHNHCFCDGVKNICGWFGEHNSREEPLNPFIDNELPISTLLKRKQSFCFHVIF